MIYSLKWKDIPIVGLDITEEGTIVKVSKNVKNAHLIPYTYREDTKNIEKWWQERCVPLTQDFIGKILQDQNLSCPEEYLKTNLGLSLTDQYWICPLNSDLTWKDVNLFENDFVNEIFVRHLNEPEKSMSYTPNSSLKGNLEKSWNIVNGERILIKGNHNEKSIESINEVIATKVHELQGFTNHAKYELIKVHDKEYSYACYSKLFTDINTTLVSAHDLISSEKKPNDISVYEFLLQLTEKHGLNRNIVREQLEYQILTDFILTNTDRHLNNIAFFANQDNELIKIAPIFDTGKSMFVDQSYLSNTKDLLSIEVNSFRKKEIDLLKYVTNKNIVDLTKLPAVSDIKKLYEQDKKISKTFIQKACDGYEKKIELCRDFQLGKDLHKIKVFFKNKEIER